MVYQDVKRFLKRYLKKPLLSQKWGTKDNFHLLELLQDRYSNEQIDGNEIEIRQAFRDFFEPIGNLIVRYKKNIGITCKIFPYRAEVSTSKHLSKLVHIIQENRRAIEHPYNGKNDQIALTGKIRRKINFEIAESNENVNKKELIRYAIKVALGLDEQDIVVNLKKKYIIKLFHKNSFVKNKIEHTEKKEQYDEKEFKEWYEEIFQEIDIMDFLDNVMVSLFVEKLNFEKINNVYYEKNVLTLIKNKILEDLNEVLTENDEYLSHLAGYILKENLTNIHERVAIEIFEKITNKNLNAKNFLNYYTGQIYIEKGKRYVIPEITTEDGKRWNINSLISTSSGWLRSRSLLIKLRIKIKNTIEKIDGIMTFYKIAKKKQEEIKSELNKVEKHYKEFTQLTERASIKLKNELKGSMDNKKETELMRDIHKDRKTLNELRRKINELRAEKTDRDAVYAKYNDTLIEHKQIQQSLVSQIQILEQDLDLNSDSFHSILSSVVKALIKRKKMLGHEG